MLFIALYNTSFRYILYTVSPQINIHALIFEGALSVRKKVHALILFFKKDSRHYIYSSIQLSWQKHFSIENKIYIIIIKKKKKDSNSITVFFITTYL